MGNGSVFTFHYVSINTAERSWETRRTDSFTFHYVSINTELGNKLQANAKMIYIPLCFY